MVRLSALEVWWFGYGKPVGARWPVRLIGRLCGLVVFAHRGSLGSDSLIQCCHLHPRGVKKYSYPKSTQLEDLLMPWC